MWLKMSIAASATYFAVIDFGATASGQCVAMHAAVKMNLAPP